MTPELGKVLRLEVQCSVPDSVEIVWKKIGAAEIISQPTKDGIWWFFDVRTRNMVFRFRGSGSPRVVRPFYPVSEVHALGEGIHKYIVRGVLLDSMRVV